MSNDEHRFETMDWFDLSLDDIQDSEDFELAMELAHIAGFEDGRLEADEHNYSDAIYEGIHGERERILYIINNYKGKPDFTFDNLISMIGDKDE